MMDAIKIEQIQPDRFVINVYDNKGLMIGRKEIPEKIMNSILHKYDKNNFQYKKAWDEFWKYIDSSNCKTFSKFVINHNRKKIFDRFIKKITL